MPNFMKLNEILSDASISEEMVNMVNSLPETGKEALNNYFDPESAFQKHSQDGHIVYQFAINTERGQYDDLYHYTTVDSLKKILESKKWLIKQKDFMNDPKEFSYTVDLGLDILRKLGATNDERNIFTQSIGISPFGDTYIWSFSCNRNSQTLFGNYSGSKDGVALRFSVHDIQVALATHFSHGKTDPNKLTYGDAYVAPLKVVYDKNIQLEYMEPVIKEWLLAVRNLAQDPDDMNVIVIQCLSAIGLFGLCFKNPLLRQEEEIRFVIINKNKDNQRHPELQSNGVPFVQCEISDILIKEAVLQTGNKVSTNVLKNIVTNLGFSGIKISKSDLPY